MRDIYGIFRREPGDYPPGNREVEIEQEPQLEEEFRGQASWVTILYAVLLGALFVLAMRIAAPWLLAPVPITLLVIAGPILGLSFYLRYFTPKTALLLGFSGVGLVLVLGLVSTFSLAAPLAILPAVAFLALSWWLADSLGHHALRKQEALSHPEEKPAFLPLIDKPGTAEQPLFGAGLKNRLTLPEVKRAFFVGAISTAMLVCLLLLADSMPGPRGALRGCAVIASTFVFFFSAIWSASNLSGCGTIAAQAELGKEIWDSLKRFLSTEPDVRPGILTTPITFQSESNSQRRWFSVSLVFFVAAFSILPLAFYFPLTLVFQTPWREASHRAVANVSADDIRENLTKAESEYFSGLTDKKKAEYLEARAARADSAAVADENKKAEARAFSFMESAPENWISVSGRLLFRSPVFFLVTVSGALLLSVVVPVFFSLTALFLFAAPLFSKAKELSRHVEENAADTPEAPAGEASAVSRNDEPSSQAESDDEVQSPSAPSTPPAWLLSRVPGENEAWTNIVSGLLASKDPTERESIFVGDERDIDDPKQRTIERLIVPREVLREHGHILGSSGSGKTARALAPMIAQLIRLAGRDACEYAEAAHSGEKSGFDLPRRSSIVVIDLKGDPALFHGTKLEAERARLPFKWFTTRSGRSSFLFNPFLQSHLESIRLNEKSETFLEALGLVYEDAYGASYFSSVHRNLFSALLLSHGDEIQSFADFEQFLESDRIKHLADVHSLGGKELENAGHLFGVLKGLGRVPPLNGKPGVGYADSVFEDQIDFAGVVSEPQVIYFYLPATLQAATIREIGRLALQMLLTAAVTKEEGTNHQVYLFVDEFQQIVSQNLEVVLRQARSHDIAAVLAHQTISDLKNSFNDLIPTVQENTRFKQVFAATDLRQQDDLIALSGEQLDYVGSFQPDGDDMLFTGDTEKPVPRYTRNHIIRVSDQPDLSIVHITRQAGYAVQRGFPRVVSSSFHIDETEYKRRLHRTSWPKEDDSIGAFLPKSQDELADSRASQPIPPASPGTGVEAALEGQKNRRSGQSDVGNKRKNKNAK